MAKPSKKRSAPAKRARGGTQPFCKNVARPVRVLPAAVTANPLRAAAIISSSSKWMNGTVLHYCFFRTGHFSVPSAQADAIRAAFAKWKAVGIGLEFQEVDQLSEAEVRIGYSTTDGSSASAV